MVNGSVQCPGVVCWGISKLVAAMFCGVMTILEHSMRA